jgi:hypothetical protein
LCRSGFVVSGSGVVDKNINLTECFGRSLYRFNRRAFLPGIACNYDGMGAELLCLLLKRIESVLASRRKN